MQLYIIQITYKGPVLRGKPLHNPKHAQQHLLYRGGVSVYAYVHIHIDIDVYIYTYGYIDRWIDRQIHIYVYIYMSIYIYVYVYANIYIWHVQKETLAYMSAW